MTSDTAVILINLGTPTVPDASSVRRYLREFLMDPEVIDLPWIARAALVYGVILPTRPQKTAALYQKIWNSRGSPLLYHSLDLTEGLKKRFESKGIPVELGMRYGSPSISEALERLSACKPKRLIALPLFPQYSLAATRSAEKELTRCLRQLHLDCQVDFISDFYEQSDFVHAFSEILKQSQSEFKSDHVVFSFHGLPERQVMKTDLTGQHCLKSSSCCNVIGSANQKCYRAQCFATANAIAQRTGLSFGSYTVSFQSRLGGTPWIKPYTDHLYDDFPKRGIKRLLVISPSFVADCLETLEEIAIRGKDQFLQAGGEDLRLVPSLNSHPLWISAVEKMIQARIKSF